MERNDKKQLPCKLTNHINRLEAQSGTCKNNCHLRGYGTKLYFLKDLARK